MYLAKLYFDPMYADCTTALVSEQVSTPYYHAKLGILKAKSTHSLNCRTLGIFPRG